MKLSIVFLIFIFFSFGALAETYQYLLKGSYKLDSSRKDPVNYSVKWSEENGRISGVYSDDLFAKSASVSGEGNESGRTFLVRLPEEKGGVKSMMILASIAKSSQTAVSLPVSIITRDKAGNPLTTVKSTSQFSTTDYRSVAQLQEENRCSEGFGVLAGYCGVYAGLLSEEQDRRNRCNLLFSDAVRFELSSDGTMILHLGEENEYVTSPGHSIGRIPFNPQKNSVDVMSRVCGPLIGVNSSSTSCKVIHLSGDFSTRKSIRHFSGTYTISEENTNNNCRYGLSMDRME